MVRIILRFANFSFPNFNQSNSSGKFLKKIFFIILLTISAIYAQDSTRSEVFRDDFPRRRSIVKAKYPSYSLIAGYILTRDANRGDPFAQHELGVRYLLGSGFPKDTSKAIYWIHKAVEQNLPAAQFNYGIMLYNGIGVPWNPFEAYTNFKNASTYGLPEAQFAEGMMYTDNLTTTRDYNKAYTLFKLSAVGKYKPATEALDQLLKSGFIPPNDPTFRAPAKLKDETSQVLNANWDVDLYDFEKSNKDTSERFIKEILSTKKGELKKYLGIESMDSSKVDTTANSLLSYAAQSGSPEAMVLIARSYEKGLMFPKDIAKAASYYLRANRLGSFKAGETLYRLVQSESFISQLKEKVVRGDADAMYAWAGITALGYSNQIASQQALDFLKKAVDKKHIPSMIEMGLLYINGTMVEKNKEKAFYYWKMAKDLGSKEAEVRIAFANILEKNSSSNLSEDIKTLDTITNEGSVFAQTALAYCYEKGIGMREDKAMAVKLYRHAAQRGNQSAFNSLKRLYDELRPDDETFKIFETAN
jgi:uncharacterized protein